MLVGVDIGEVVGVGVVVLVGDEVVVDVSGNDVDVS